MKNYKKFNLTREETIEKGYKAFNNNDHTVIDLSEMKEGTHTVSIRLPNGEDVTVGIVPFFSADGGKTVNLDIKYHADKGDSKVISLGDHLYALETKQL